MSLFIQQQVEAVAQVIYEQWKDVPGYVPWVKGGNSLKQDAARTLARDALLSVKLELPQQLEETQDSQNSMRVYQYGVAKGYNRCLEDVKQLVNCYV